MFVIYYTCLRHCATSRKIAGSIPDCLIGIFFIDIILTGRGAQCIPGLSPGVRAAGALTTDNHLAPRLKEE